MQENEENLISKLMRTINCGLYIIFWTILYSLCTFGYVYGIVHKQNENSNIIYSPSF